MLCLAHRLPARRRPPAAHPKAGAGGSRLPGPAAAPRLARRPGRPPTALCGDAQFVTAGGCASPRPPEVCPAAAGPAPFPHCRHSPLTERPANIPNPSSYFEQIGTNQLEKLAGFARVSTRAGWLVASERGLRQGRSIQGVSTFCAGVFN